LSPLMAVMANTAAAIVPLGHGGQHAALRTATKLASLHHS